MTIISIRDNKRNIEHGCFESLESAYVHILHLFMMLGLYGSESLQCITDFVITEFRSHILINTFYIDNTEFNLYEHRSNTQVKFDKVHNYIEEYRGKLMTCKSGNKMNVFISNDILQASECAPIDFGTKVEDDKNDILALEEHIQALRSKREAEIKKISDLKKKATVVSVKIDDKTSLKDAMEVMAKEGRLEKKNSREKFFIDKDLYFKIKGEIDIGFRDEDNIPDVFINSYKMFEEFENSGLLSGSLSDDELFEHYLTTNVREYNKVAMNFDIFRDDTWMNKHT